MELVTLAVPPSRTSCRARSPYRSTRGVQLPWEPVATYPFLSDEWIAEARALRERYAEDVPPPPVPVRLNVVVVDIPHRDEDLQGHIDSSKGQTIIEQGHLDEPDLTITIDYGTAKAAFVTRDQQAVMQSFLTGKILVDGDASKLLALQAGPPEVDPVAIEIYEQMQAFTAED